MEYNIKKEYKGNYSRKLAIADSEFGEVKLDLINVRAGHKVTIQSALNKNAYFKNQLKSIFPNKKIKVIGKYEKLSSKILISIDGILYNCLPKNLIKGILPNILSAVDKNKCFISQAKQVHGNKYNYDLCIYTNYKDLVDIKCKIHGVFKQAPKSHLKGSACGKCGTLKACSNRLTHTKGIKNAIVYCLKIIEDDGTEFYKIGFTRHSILYRYDNVKWINRMPYKYEIVFEKVYSYKKAIMMERKLHSSLASYHYIPKIKFDGSATECYTKIK